MKKTYYKQQTQKATILFFSFGLIVGSSIEKYLAESIYTSFLNRIIELNFTKKFLLFINNHNELNSILLLDLCSYISILSTLVLFLVWDKWISSKNLSKPQFTDSLSIKNISMFIYGSYWLLTGVMTGVIFLKYLILVLSLRNYLSENSKTLLNDGSASDICTYLNTHVPFFGFYVIMYILFIIISTYYIISVRRSIKNLSTEVINSITNFYRTKFPYIEIKTQLGDVKGQLMDIQNKYLITLCEANNLKMVNWDKIEIIEVKNKPL